MSLNSYRPQGVPAMGDLGRYTEGELRKVGRALEDVLDYLPQPASAAPAQPRVGMQRLATAPWRPLGGSADRWVYWTGAAWAAL